MADSTIGIEQFENQNGYATVFSLFISLLLFSICSTFVIVAQVLSIKLKAIHAAEEAAITTASTQDCGRASKITQSNEAEIIICNISPEYVYIKSFTRFNKAQISLFIQL